MREGSDAWRVTSYGFVNATENALLAQTESEFAAEVPFHRHFSGQFDQADIFVRIDEEIMDQSGRRAKRRRRKPGGCRHARHL
ncbi:DUF1349 domain-containing protein [Arthrobacter sp. ZBG10]|uniref:DUF1349 domain-containing protein n=1 Tax=Arthrobacter sp. ZBG10 TaxID=1676590 RepID=UPI000B2CF356|nr:DUF1349 domain-containing protein [Arthrobacter sp. ZBG10]